MFYISVLKVLDDNCAILIYFLPSLLTYPYLLIMAKYSFSGC